MTGISTRSAIATALSVVVPTWGGAIDDHDVGIDAEHAIDPARGAALVIEGDGEDRDRQVARPGVGRRGALRVGVDHRDPGLALNGQWKEWRRRDLFIMKYPIGRKRMLRENFQFLDIIYNIG